MLWSSSRQFGAASYGNIITHLGMRSIALHIFTDHLAPAITPSQGGAASYCDIFARLELRKRGEAAEKRGEAVQFARPTKVRGTSECGPSV